MVDVAQLVRASDCGSESRGFEPHLPPKSPERGFFVSVFQIIIMETKVKKYGERL